MTNEYFVEWLQLEHGCIFHPVEGSNISGCSVKVINPKQPNLYYYLRGPFTDKPIPDRIVKSICDRLAVKYPNCVMDKE